MPTEQKYFVAEIITCCGTCRSTWTVKAASISHARKILEQAAGARPHSIDEIKDFPMRHWKAG